MQCVQGDRSNSLACFVPRCQKDADCHFDDLANQLHFVGLKAGQEVYISFNEMVISWKWESSED